MTMPRKSKISADTLAIIQAITMATNAAKEVTDKVEEDLKHHQALDDQRFDKILEMLDSAASSNKVLSTNVQSLLDSREFQRGAWKVIAIIGASIGTITSIATMIVKHFTFG